MNEQTIAELMAILIVDRFEAIEIQITDGQQTTVAACLQHGNAQPVGQQDPVRQLGQCVVMRQMLKASLVGFQIGDVGEHREIVIRR